jgi:hypothetical protein
MRSDTRPPETPRDTIRTGAREVSGIWWWFVLLGVLWTLFGLYVLSYRVGSLAAVAALVGVAFLFGGLTQLAVASRVQQWRWLLSSRGSWGGRRDPHLRLAFHHLVCGVDPGGLVPGRLWDRAPGRRAAGPKLSYWWTGLLLGAAELVLGVWRCGPGSGRC